MQLDLASLGKVERAGADRHYREPSKVPTVWNFLKSKLQSVSHLSKVRQEHLAPRMATPPLLAF